MPRPRSVPLAAALAVGVVLATLVLVLVLVLRSGGPALDRARAEQVKRSVNAYLSAYAARDWAAACQRLTPSAQQDVIRSARVHGIRPMSCVAAFASRPIEGGSTSPPPAPVPIVIDNLARGVATAHQAEGSSRITLVQAGGGWLIDRFSFGPPTGVVSSPRRTAVFFMVIALISFAIGASGAKWRWAAILPTLWIGVGIWDTAIEPASTDQGGLFLLVCIVYALAGLTITVAGRILRALARSVRRAARR